MWQRLTDGQAHDLYQKAILAERIRIAHDPPNVAQYLQYRATDHRYTEAQEPPTQYALHNEGNA